jgi:hypothetical protein
MKNSYCARLPGGRESDSRSQPAEAVPLVGCRAIHPGRNRETTRTGSSEAYRACRQAGHDSGLVSAVRGAEVRPGPASCPSLCRVRFARRNLLSRATRRLTQILQPRRMNILAIRPRDLLQEAIQTVAKRPLPRPGSRRALWAAIVILRLPSYNCPNSPGGEKCLGAFCIGVRRRVPSRV